LTVSRERLLDPFDLYQVDAASNDHAVYETIIRN
jgi:hypothetical protein